MPTFARMIVLVIAMAVTVVACDPTAPPPATPTPAASRAIPTPSISPSPTPVAFDPRAALRTIQVLAEEIGPREASSAAYRRAADFVQRRLTEYGHAVLRQSVPIPAGVSWGVPVPAGTTYNIIAVPRGFDRRQPHLLVGAHLDTVPQAPGAEDNASGVAIMLELARMTAAQPPRVPVVFVAFGAEEPRGSGDARHHYGSRAYVADHPPPTGMVSLDRVGVGNRVRICTGGRGPRTVANELLAAARRADFPAVRCENRASDHWSFEKAGIAAARIGATPYAEYHSSRDRIGVVDERQLARVGPVMWEWLSAQR